MWVNAPIRRGFWQGDQAKIAVGRAERLRHDAFDLAPFAVDVTLREHEQRLTAAHHPTLHLFDARRATGEIAIVDKGPEPGFFDAPQ